MVCDVCGEAWEFCDEVGATAPELTRCQGYRERRASDARHQATLDRRRALEAIEAAAVAWVAADDAHGRAGTLDEENAAGLARWKAAEALRAAVAKVTT